MSTILEKIYGQRANDVELSKSTPGSTPDDISALLKFNLAPPLIDFIDRLKRNPSTTPSPSLMAEIKRASPSKGPISLTTNVAQQSLTYALSGASVISVLTEPTWFKGSLHDMLLARHVLSSLPDRPAVLRKDFILDEYQIAEARLWGADTILLIVAMLSQERLEALYKYSLSMGMEPLVEVNNAEEMNRALALNARVIGVNNRNLHSFHVDMGTTSRLVDLVKDRDVILCALSGISTPQDVQTYRSQGVRAVLIGEALMRAPDPASFISNLLNWPAKQKQTSLDLPRPLIKINSALSTNEVINAKADMIGLKFYPENPSGKPTSLETAKEIAHRIREVCHISPFDLLPSSTTSEPSAAPWFTSQVRRLLSSAKAPLLVGIFKNQPLDYIIHTSYACDLDLVQLDGSEPLSWASHIPIPVIRKIDFRIQHSSQTQVQTESLLLAQLHSFLRPGFHAFVLISGDQTTNWAPIRKLLEIGDSAAGSEWPMPVIIEQERKGCLKSEDSITSALEWALDSDLT